MVKRARRRRSADVAIAPGTPEQLTKFGRVLWGTLGGLAAVLVKFWGQDLYWVRVHLDTREYERIWNMGAFYLVMLIVLCALGAIIAYASEEHHRFKLLGLAVAAPALVTTWAGGVKAEASHLSFDFLIQTAYAADKDATQNTGSISILDGARQFFGIGRDSSRYRVIIGSYKDPTEAAITAAKLAKELPNQNVYVGQRQPDNQFYPVIVGDYLPYPAASKLKDEVMTNDALKAVVKDPYLSPYPYR